MAATATFSTESSVLGTEQGGLVGFDLSSDTWRVSFIQGSSMLYQIARNQHGKFELPQQFVLMGGKDSPARMLLAGIIASIISWK